MAVRTTRKSEVHAVRWVGDRIAVAGRVYSQPLEDGSGWDGYVGIVAPARREVVAYSVVDVDRGDVILDLAALPDGRSLAAGSTGYVQNPAGVSVSEVAQPLLAVLQPDGRFNQRVRIEAGPRHNQVRSLAPWQARWLAGGLLNGPGTHSGDSDPAGLVADGFVRESAVPTPP